MYRGPLIICLPILRPGPGDLPLSQQALLSSHPSHVAVHLCFLHGCCNPCRGQPCRSSILQPSDSAASCPPSTMLRPRLLCLLLRSRPLPMPSAVRFPTTVRWYPSAVASVFWLHVLVVVSRRSE